MASVHVVVGPEAIDEEVPEEDDGGRGQLRQIVAQRGDILDAEVRREEAERQRGERVVELQQDGGVDRPSGDVDDEELSQLVVERLRSGVRVGPVAVPDEVVDHGVVKEMVLAMTRGSPSRTWPT